MLDGMRKKMHGLGELSSFLGSLYWFLFFGGLAVLGLIKEVYLLR